MSLNDREESWVRKQVHAEFMKSKQKKTEPRDVGSFKRILDIECYDPCINTWAQATFLVHGIDDVLWTDSPEVAADYIRDELTRFMTGAY